MQELDWNDLRIVLAIERGGTLSAAAEQLSVDETTVARRLARLEAALGPRLFRRSGGCLLPTEAGRILVAQAERSEIEIERSVERLRGTEAAVSGTVRVTAVPLLVNHLLVPRLPALLRAHPGLEVELVAEPGDLSLSRREADLALRMARPTREQRLLARRIATLAYGVYAARSRKPSTLPWIGYEARMRHLPPARWLAERASRPGETASPLRANDAEALLQAVRAGLGRSLLPCLVADRTPGLRRLDGPAPAIERELWLLVHPDLRQVGRVRAVIDWLEATVAMG